MSQIALTPEQMKIVAHTHGPALVFAVAGAGKTTAMVHRIEALVRRQIFAARRMLATSFSRATVQDLRQALSHWPHCREVQTLTLHAVGLQVLQQAQELGLLAGLDLGRDSTRHPESFLLKRSLARARQQGLELPPNLDEQDFLAYISVCKGNFRYPKLPTHLPASALAQVSLAEAPEDLPYYLDLFAIFETLRQANGLITFDDMLLSAWEALHSFPDLLRRFQARWDCLLVDEFQDVNAVQHELLDLLSAQHRNYMAIGDDDQTIYEWRGASPRFILDFPQRYAASKYLLRDNFRSRASHLALANRVIVHNLEREPKQLQLTRGFAGQTQVHRVADEAAQAQQVLLHILQACQAGYAFAEQAILVRLYAQTPHLEQALISASVPYRMVGSVPFYQRKEIQTLLAYLTLGRYERQLRSAQALTASQMERFQTAWLDVANRPVRYLSRQGLDGVLMQVRQGQSLTQALERQADQADTAYQARLVRKLAELLDWLAQSGLDQSAYAVLTELETNLKYCQFLRKSSGFAETGEGRALTVEAFLGYTQGLASCAELETHLAQLAQLQQATEVAVTITTIFRAKGLEWPVVYLPHCNQGYLPYATAERLEEERRLFYVAVTRPRESLQLYTLNHLPVSQFLTEAAYEQTLSQVQKAQGVLKRQVLSWEIDDMLTLLQSDKSLLLSPYLEHWWDVPREWRRQAREQIGQFLYLAQQEELLDKLNLSRQDLTNWSVLTLPTALPSVLPALPTVLPETTQVFKQALQTYLDSLSSASSTALATEPDYVAGERVWSDQMGPGTILGLETQPQHGLLLEVAFENGKRLKLAARYANLKPLPPLLLAEPAFKASALGASLK